MYLNAQVLLSPSLPPSLSSLSLSRSLVDRIAAVERVDANAQVPTKSPIP